MREILFRGKSRSTKEWVYGSLIIDHYDMAGKTDDDYKIIDILYGYDESGMPDFQSGVSECVEPSTVGQYTGLTDKNGKKIFEGDIIYTTLGATGGTSEIKYEDGTFIWSPPDTGRWFSVGDHDESIYCYQGVCDKSVVVGNIHDNPELLEEA